ncbi:hypothetical protein HAX54_013249 [Datura stramonium]|uniref:Uncharacterized protein n=1 Tax=Datura stramonium TaxID=4076 RepID=A0ABS8TML6_DATST|nr:hypothetical protein [Datura stramonium]
MALSPSSSLREEFNQDLRHEATFHDLRLMEMLDTNHKDNLTLLVIKYMMRVMNPEWGAHGLAYGCLLTKVYEAHQLSNARVVSLEGENAHLRADINLSNE